MNNSVLVSDLLLCCYFVASLRVGNFLDHFHQQCCHQRAETPENKNLEEI